MESTPGTTRHTDRQADGWSARTTLDAASARTHNATGASAEPAALGVARPARFHLEVDGEVPAELLELAKEAVAELNRLGAQTEGRAAARQLFDAVATVRRRGHRAWLV
ncbi:hypothetical protein K2Z84_07280 [Candidatus Binatia bacterium]|jgi:hypothetical protein|nr:hypothetical protein [Candidatus Binatia bacterium]